MKKHCMFHKTFKLKCASCRSVDSSIAPQKCEEAKPQLKEYMVPLTSCRAIVEGADKIAPSKGEALNAYYKACNRLLFAFIRKYYTDKETTFADVSWFWVGDNIGGVAFINDDFLNMYDIAEVMELNPEPDKFFEWMEYRNEKHMEGKDPINLRTYLIMK